MQSAVYTGSLRHRRLQPRRHEFTYPIFMTFLEVDRIPELMQVSPFTSYNRWNWASFYEKDHFGDPNLPLRRRLADDATREGLSLPGGPVFLLTHLRYLGYVFNPVSYFYCCNSRGSVEAVLAEVNNTFGESHNYWLWSANRETSDRSLRYRCRKVMHVSPFNGMDQEYQFILTEPAERLTIHMNTLEGGRTVLDATLSLRQRPWSAPALHSALLRHPWMTAKVIAAIHWEALKLYLKKVPVYTHPAKVRGD
ncbi:MAG: DUF1365 domain-containing protein [Acidobacteria bacterium]|nr:DUF1365 domain-containing protein [Acidobacteriota bacterium]